MGLSESASAGTWTKLTNSYPIGGGSGTMILMTDGTVLVQGPGVTSSWRKLTPDSSGNYINGTWSSIASMGTARLYVGSNVMPNGKLFILGGEYSGPSGAQNITNTGEIYDPVLNTWTPITFPLPVFGDDPTILLPNGKILCGYIFDGSTYLFNPANNTFTQSGTKLRGDRSDEETWVMLPNGNVLSYDIFASPESGAGSAQKYDSQLGTWSDAGVVPVPLTGTPYGFELGPASVLPNGKVIQIGANNNTVIYTPGTNTWAQGPSLPTNYGSDDAPGVMVPDGHFLFLADNSAPSSFSAPTKLFDYDYSTNQITDITSTLPSSLQNYLAGNAAYYQRFLNLPNGHVLYANGSEIWDYASSTSPLAQWKPTITGITKGTGVNANVYTLTGTQLTGLWQGASYGDDVEMDSNYPIIKLTNGAKSYYAKTTNWTPGITAVGSTAKTTVQFTLPAGLPNATYQLSVSANGISSATTTFTVPFVNTNLNYVQASYSGGVLTLTGDAGANSVTVTQRGTLLTVEGAGNTLIGNVVSNSQQVNFTISGGLTITGNFTQSATPPTNDSVSIVGATIAGGSTLNFGSGADTANISYCTVPSPGTFTINGGAGTDKLVSVANKGSIVFNQ